MIFLSYVVAMCFYNVDFKISVWKSQILQIKIPVSSISLFYPEPSDRVWALPLVCTPLYDERLLVCKVDKRVC